MSIPVPLTLCDPPKIDWSRDAAPAATGFNDIYFSTDGGLDEARSVFLKACGLPERWVGRDYFAIGELGFGTGLNFLATWQLWQENKSETGRLHFISIEKYPLDRQQLSKAHSAWPELSEFSTKLIDQWPGRVKGFHHLEFGDVSLTLVHDDILSGLSEISGKVDAWFLDGFSPAKNPDMWSPKVMQEVAGLSNLGARVGTFTVARGVRETLSDAGFVVSKEKGFGRKRDRLEAVFGAWASGPKIQSVRPIIIGAGIAGANLAASFKKRGIASVVIDPDDGTGASCNAAAILKPRMDIQDRPESRFFMASYLHALRLYQKTQAILHRGIQHLSFDEKQAQRFGKLLKHTPLPEEHFRTSVSSLAEHVVEFPQGLVVDPAKLRSELLLDIKLIKGQAASVKNMAKDIEVLDGNGVVLAAGSHAIWTCGYGIRELPQFAELKLRYSRGQVTSVEANLEDVVTYGNYAIPMTGDVLIGATHKRLDDLSPFEVRVEDDVENIEKFEAVFSQSCQALTGKSRSSVRVTTPTTLPMIFGDDKEWGLTGLGSRGFVFAPLLAEAIVANICGEVSPISNKVWTRFRAREKDPT